ncbi:motile sperm domain-containing protein 1 [Microcaecilia unicolor]|uniref:Motile sperm domain-containing protein 3 n=1 Tax=Microcaecilia unicolor TaxID=1415580 RepID=A0A6P7X0I7_9AMPH|nr:motile sperm domain-containing protein 1-like [Microcaecilia unicolor]XP_030043660.1 motile sperm domain-containing protein 1-like [Microcaecilia unicolor]
MRRGPPQTPAEDRRPAGAVEAGNRKNRQEPAAFTGSVPVFVFPAELVFYADNRSSHKQVLTLYNPFSSVLRFRVLCTAPSRYSVVDAKGHVRPQSCVDIVVRHKDISTRHYGIVDKFRIEISEEGTRKILGQKDIPSALYPTKRLELNPVERRREAPANWYPSYILSLQRGSSRPLSPGILALHICVGAVCLCLLILPLQGEPSLLVPESLHVSVIQKLVAAYVLGLLTMAFLQG